MAGLDSISAGNVNQYYANPYYANAGALNDDFLAQGTNILSAQPQLPVDTVNFQGAYAPQEEPKKNHTALKVIGAGVAIAGAVLLHKNWDKVSKFVKGLFKSNKSKAVEVAESINKKATTSAAQIDKSLGIDKASIARRARKVKSSQAVFGAKDLDLSKTVSRNNFVHHYAPVEAEQKYFTSYKPITKKEIAANKKALAAKRKAVRTAVGVRTNKALAPGKVKLEHPVETKFQAHSSDFETWAAAERAKLVEAGILPKPKVV